MRNKWDRNADRRRERTKREWEFGFVLLISYYKLLNDFL